MKFVLEKKEPWVQRPEKESTDDVGYALYNAYTTTIPRGKCVELPTGIIFPETEGYVVFILGKLHTSLNKCLSVKRKFVGSGELSITCVNMGEDDVDLAPQTRLTEFVVLKVSQGDPILTHELDQTARGERGFGSTGVL